MTFTIKYQETYASDYIVEAESLEKAIDKLRYDIFVGRENGPEECIDSSYRRIMKLRIYQIMLEKDKNNIAFMCYDSLPSLQGSAEIDASIYEPVFNGRVEASDLEEVFHIFNTEEIGGFYGRSLSVSDIIGVKDPGTGEYEWFYCDRLGFRKVDFREEDDEQNAF